MLHPCRHISIGIARPWQQVYSYAANPDNLVHWASGLANSEVTREGEALVASSPMGKVTIRFVMPNQLGVLDHDVTLPSGQVVHNAMRVLPNGEEGAEVVFTLFHLPDMSREAYEADVAHIQKDLATLKNLLED